MELESAADVIDALGGIAATAKLTGSGYTAAHNWKANGCFPPKTYVVMNDALHAKGLNARVALWRMVESAE